MPMRISIATKDVYLEMILRTQIAKKTGVKNISDRIKYALQKAQDMQSSAELSFRAENNRCMR